MYESMSRDLAPLSLSVVAIVIFLILSATFSADPAATELDREAPVAVAGPDRTVGPGDTVTFDGSLSTDDLGIASWQWSLEYAGVPVTFGGQTALFTFDLPGCYEVTLGVTDAAGNRAEDSFRVTVTGPGEG